MQKILLIGGGLCIAFAIGFFFVSSRDVTITNYPPHNEQIVVFGDSLVEGYGATAGNEFPARLSVLLNRPVHNLGVRGDTTADGRARLADVRRENAGVVIVLFGGNDYLRSIPVEETEENLSAIIEVLQSDGAVVVLAGVRGGILRDARKDLYKSLAETHGAVYLEDVLQGLLGNSAYMYDAIHPNDRGHARIAERLRELFVAHDL